MLQNLFHSPDLLFGSLADRVLQHPHITQAPHRIGGTESQVQGPVPRRQALDFIF